MLLFGVGGEETEIKQMKAVAILSFFQVVQ